MWTRRKALSVARLLCKCLGNLSERLLHDAARTADVHAHVAAAAGAEHLAWVEAELALVGKEAGALLLGLEAEVAAVEEDEERCFWLDDLDLVGNLGKALGEAVDVALHITEHLLAPLVGLFAIAGNGAVEGEDVAKVHIAMLDVAEVFVAQRRIGDDGVRAYDAWEVVGLGRCLQGDGDLTGLVADGGKWDVLAAAEEHVAVDLVAHYDDAFLMADMCYGAEGLNVPALAGRVVRIAEDHHLDTLEILTERVEIHGDGGLGTDKMVPHDLAVIALRDDAEWVIDRILDEHLVTFVGEGLHGQIDAADDAWHVVDVLRGDVPREVRFAPVDYTIIIGVRRTGVAEDLLREAFLDGTDDERRCLEVHVGYPHGQHVFAAAHFLHLGVLIGIGTFTLDDFVKIVIHIIDKVKID